MVAPMVAAAGISAVGSLIGGITGGKGAKKAAQTQARAQQQQLQFQQNAQNQIVGLNQPAITRGNEAASLYGNFLGVGGPGNSQQALDTFRGSTGYQDLMREGLGAVNANAYSRGMGDSGAALKALQTRGASIANQSSQQWLGNLGTLVNAGTQAAGNVSGVTQNVANNMGNIVQNGADNQSNAALWQAGNTTNTIQNLANIGAYAYGSSYGGNRNPYGIVGGGIY